MQPVSGYAVKETGISTTFEDTSHLKTDTSDANGRLKKQLPQEIDFVATGNEPFWNIETDFAKYLHFKTPGGIDMRCSTIEKIRDTDPHLNSYHAQSEKETLMIEIRKLECINDMSGEKMEYNVKVEIIKTGCKDGIIYTGCGRYTSAHR